MDILNMVNFWKLAPTRTAIDLDHVKSKISVPIILQNPVRAGPQQNVSFPLIDAPKATRTRGFSGMCLHFDEHDHSSIT